MLGSKKGIEKMMKKMNLNVQEFPAEEVIIKTAEKTLRIKNPQIMIADVMGKEVYQVSGDVEEAVNEDDVKMVMEKTGHDRETVVSKLKELDNDLARAIMELKAIEKK